MLKRLVARVNYVLAPKNVQYRFKYICAKFHAIIINWATLAIFCTNHLNQLPYLFEYNAQNFVRNFNQKLRVRVIHEFFHQHALFLFLFLDTDINVTQEEFEQLFGESDDESGFKL